MRPGAHKGILLEISPGAALGPYEVLMHVGEGGMAAVWVGRAVAGPRKGRLIALKMILPELADDVAFQQMLRDEARVASRILHANVCETFELREARGVGFLGSSGWTASLLPSARDPERRLIRHNPPPRARPAHRSANRGRRLRSQDGEIKVTDFGVAKAIGKSHRTLAGQLEGKLRYMSPEQLVDGANIDRRSDVFALGCVLHEATTGQQTFAGKRDPELMRSILLNLFEPPQALVPGYTKGMPHLKRSGSRTSPWRDA